MKVRLGLVLAAVLAAMVAAMVAPASPAAAAPKDWSTVVDFSNTGGQLSRYSAADAALLMMLSPERVKDPTQRIGYQRQLDSLKTAQSSAAALGASDKEIAAISAPLLPNGVESIDPGCQLTTSTPGGYDLCGYNSNGKLVSAWPSGREHRVWAGVQAIDAACGSATAPCWRLWLKSQAKCITDSNCPHLVEFNNIQGVYGFYPGGSFFYFGPVGPVQKSNCAPCYHVGDYHYQAFTGLDQITGSTLALRDYVRINGTGDFSDTNNEFASYWWLRGNGVSLCDGPEHKGIGC